MADNCTSISFNCSSNTLMTNLQTVCLLGFYIQPAVMCIIILPLSLCSLWLFKKTTSTQKRSASSDLLHLNLIFTSVIFCIGFIFSFIFLLHKSNTYLYYISANIMLIGLMAQAQFHTWICLEHYLAVVLPIFYLKLKQVQYKMLLVTFTWVTASVFGGLTVFMQQNSLFMYIPPFSGLFALILFCCVKTLATLKKPNPGEGERRKMHHQKMKAFRIITLTLVVLILSYLPYICFTCFWYKLSPELFCITQSFVTSFLLLGSLFQPLLDILRYLKASGKIVA